MTCLTSRHTARSCRPATPHPRSPRPRPLPPLAAPVRLAAFDIAGRHVRLLASGPKEAGPHQVTWDGLDDGGRRLGPGVYLVRLQVGRDIVVRKTLLISK